MCSTHTREKSSTSKQNALLTSKFWAVYSLSTQRHNSRILHLLLQISDESVTCSKEPICRLQTLFISNLFMGVMHAQNYSCWHPTVKQKGRTLVLELLLLRELTIHIQAKNSVSRAADRIWSQMLLMLFCSEAEIECPGWCKLVIVRLSGWCPAALKRILCSPLTHTPLQW